MAYRALVSLLLVVPARSFGGPSLSLRRPSLLCHQAVPKQNGIRGDGIARQKTVAAVNGTFDAAPPPKKRRSPKKEADGYIRNGEDKTVIGMTLSGKIVKGKAGGIKAIRKITNGDRNDNNAPGIAPVDVLTKTAIADPSFMTPQHFASQPPELLHPLTMRAITEDMKLDRLTEVQYKTMKESRSVTDSGKVIFNDVLGRARTGTGKTLAFLIPAIQTVLSSDSSPGIQILIISPTRELATQIMTQADMVLKHHKQTSVQIIMGGTNMKSDVSRFNKKLPTILVATPGRLTDHLQNTKLSSGATFASAVSNLKVLILDEADQLLEMGFRPDIFRILSFLPPVQKRQTLLFSATMPKDLREVMSEAMKANFKTVDCIHDYGDGNSNRETNAHVKQSHVVMPPGMDRLVVGVIEVMLAAMKDDKDYKIIAFFPTARLVGYFAKLINLGILKDGKSSAFPPVIEIHSKKSQAYRSKASDQFRAAKTGILFTSDVSARGVDYPGVTHVVQFGLPDSREQYIHRLGRTGRAGRAGQGWLILADYERTFLGELQKGGTSGGVDVPVDHELKQLFDAPPSQEAQDLLTPVLRDQIWTGANQELVLAANQAYASWLGFYNDKSKRMVGNMSKAEQVQMANEFAKLCGLREQPALLKRTVGKMGLKGVPGLRFTKSL